MYICMHSHYSMRNILYWWIFQIHMFPDVLLTLDHDWRNLLKWDKMGRKDTFSDLDSSMYFFEFTTIPRDNSWEALLNLRTSPCSCLMARGANWWNIRNDKFSYRESSCLYINSKCWELTGPSQSRTKCQRRYATRWQLWRIGGTVIRGCCDGRRTLQRETNTSRSTSIWCLKFSNWAIYTFSTPISKHRVIIFYFSIEELRI